MLVSIGLPVRNGADRMGDAVQSALKQDHADIELVISDNASTDHTEEYCRELARADSRVVYHRQPVNVGVVGNFDAVLRLSRGTYFRWMGDDDLLEPNCVSRSLEVFAEDERLVLVTSETMYTGPDGAVMKPPTYRGTRLLSDDPIDRFTEMMVVHTQEHMLLDPLYGLMRREAVARVPRPVMLREDEVFAVMLALAGPWGHVPEILAHRGLRFRRLPEIARALGVPEWTVHFATTLQFAAVVRHLRTLDLTPEQRRRAWEVVARTYARRQRQTLSHRTRKAARLALAALRR
ncbi:glycosyltransferase family 2 protein [Microbispora sp. GKU 823]|uniref:glycosyltransferase family 2 protein n=1 Tax=Microbispora sp. GKU 823 TaxID=1652100 RepID=UPI0009A2CB6B|nr:glycosyltransferase family 2 protein [Microbispora sp. GKU 823]OPG03135.1 glycosyltransferase [Microbispora sp. GKU 823]